MRHDFCVIVPVPVPPGTSLPVRICTQVVPSREVRMCWIHCVLSVRVPRLRTRLKDWQGQRDDPRCELGGTREQALSTCATDLRADRFWFRWGVRADRLPCGPLTPISWVQ